MTVKINEMIAEFSERFPNTLEKDHWRVVKGTYKNYFSEQGLRDWYDENADNIQKNPNFVRERIEEESYFYFLTHSDI